MMNPQTPQLTSGPQHLIQWVNTLIEDLQSIPLAPYPNLPGDPDSGKTPEQRRADYIRRLENGLQDLNQGVVSDEFLMWIASLDSLVKAGGDA